MSGILEGQTYKMFVELTGVSDEGVVTWFHIYIYIDNNDTSFTDSLMDRLVESLSAETREWDLTMYCFKKTVADSIPAKEHNRSFESDDVHCMYDSNRIVRREGKGWRRNDR